MGKFLCVRTISVSLGICSIFNASTLAFSSEESLESPYSPPAVQTVEERVDLCENLWFRRVDSKQGKSNVSSVFNDPKIAKERIATISNLLNVNVVRYRSIDTAEEIPGTLFIIEAKDDGQFLWVHAQLPELDQEDSRVLQVDVNATFPSLEMIGFTSVGFGAAALVASAAFKETLYRRLGDDLAVLTGVTSFAFVVVGAALVIFDLWDDLFDSSSTNDRGGHLKNKLSDAHFSRFYTEISHHVTDQQTMGRVPRNEPFAFFICEGPAEEWSDRLRKLKEFSVIKADKWLKSSVE